jgi:glyoxylate/hydroxypyruvate reductase A
MTLNILFSDDDARWGMWEAPLRAAFTARDLSANLHRTQDNPADVHYVIYAPSSGLLDFSPFTALRAVLSTWAGVDQIVGNETITCPITRMSDDGLKSGMVEYVTGHVMRYHLGLDQHINNPEHLWRPETSPKLAKDCTVGILGLGALGLACAQTLHHIGYDVHGWSRSAKQVDNITTHKGTEGLTAILSTSDLIVLLLPDTPQTRHVINAETLAHMKTSACLINAGRGALVDEPALIIALNNNAITHATLDVFETEPLPKDSPFWSMPNVTVTPHIAAETRPETAAALIAENIWRNESGQEMRYVVDRKTGY